MAMSSPSSERGSEDSDDSVIAIADDTDSESDIYYDEESDSEDAGIVTSETASSHSFRWQIVNFDSRLQHGADVSKIQSPLFAVNGSNQFKLKLHTREPSQEDQGATVVDIWLFPEQKIDFEMSVTLSILNKTGKRAFYSKKKLQPRKSQGPELPTSLILAPIHKLTAEVNKSLLFGGTLTIMCKVEVPECRIPNCDQRLLEFDKFENLLSNNTFSDFTFNVGERKFHVHKAIVACKSEVFANMFKVKVEDSDHNSIKLEDIACPVFEELLRFIYTGKVNNMKENALDLLIAADKYAIDGLTKQCQDHLIHDLDVENVIQYLKVASFLNAGELKSQSINFIAQHADEVTNQPRFSLDELPKDVITEAFRAVARKRIKRDTD